METFHDGLSNRRLNIAPALEPKHLLRMCLLTVSLRLCVDRSDKSPVPLLRLLRAVAATRPRAQRVFMARPADGVRLAVKLDE